MSFQATDAKPGLAVLGAGSAGAGVEDVDELSEGFEDIAKLGPGEGAVILWR